MATRDLTAARLRELLQYNPDSGQFRRLVRTSNRIKAGDVAGCLAGEGYLHIRVDGGLYKSHRLAWLYMTGAWPIGSIDHIDGCRTNNAIANLRDVTKSVNLQNQRKARADNASGLLGVSAHHGRWQARITVDGKRLHIGSYATPELAHAAYITHKRAWHIGCTV